MTQNYVNQSAKIMETGPKSAKTPILHTTQVLYLNNNNLKVIRTGTLCGIINLTYLRLDGNVIEWIQCGAFRDLGKLEKLKLYQNKLPAIRECVFNVGAQPTGLRMWLDGNPWICNEELSWVLTGRGIWITLRDGNAGECASPCELAGRKLTALAADDLKSTPEYGQFSVAVGKFRINDGFDRQCELTDGSLPGPYLGQVQSSRSPGIKM